MPQGATNLRENRFALLANDSPPKKKKLSKGTSFNFFPELPTTDLPNPKYVVLSCTEENKSISDFSCFSVHKSIQLISKEIISISELRDGNLLLLVKNGKIAEKFLASSNLLGVCNIKCTLHDQLNTTKGTVYAPYLNKVPETEIVNELKSQGVISAFKFNKFLDGKAVPSGVILLSFNSYHLPSKIEISWHSVQVKEYIPNPMRCKTCQLLGHTAKWCKNSPACVNCNLPPHSPNDCTRTLCANCLDNHAASSKDCQKFQQQKEILSIKTKNKCSLQEARKIFRSQLHGSLSNNTTSYASVVSNTAHNATISSQAQIINTSSKSIKNNTINLSVTESTKNQIRNPKTQNNYAINDNISPSLLLSKSKTNALNDIPTAPNNTMNSVSNITTHSQSLPKIDSKQLSRSHSNTSIDLFPDELDSIKSTSNTSSPTISNKNPQDETFVQLLIINNANLNTFIVQCFLTFIVMYIHIYY